MKPRKPLPRKPRNQSARLVYSQKLLLEHVAPGELRESDLFDVGFSATEPDEIFVVAWDYRTRRCYTYHQNTAPGQLGLQVLDQTEGL